MGSRLSRVSALVYEGRSLATAPVGCGLPRLISKRASRRLRRQKIGTCVPTYHLCYTCVRIHYSLMPLVEEKKVEWTSSIAKHWVRTHLPAATVSSVIEPILILPGASQWIG